MVYNILWLSIFATIFYKFFNNKTFFLLSKSIKIQYFILKC